MFSRSTRVRARMSSFCTVAAATLLVAAAGSAIAAPAVPVPGHFESTNARWGLAPGTLKTPAKLEALHYSPLSHSGAGSDFMATSFFPLNKLFVKDLYELGLMVYVPAGSVCTVAGSPYVWIVLEDGTQYGKSVFAKWNRGANCPTDTWVTLDFVNGANTYWDASEMGGPVSPATNKALVTKNTSVNSFPIRVIRSNFIGGPEAWMEKVKINGQTFQERYQDFSTNALMPDLDPATAVAGATATVLGALPTVGHFQSRNVRWGLSPKALQAALSTQAMHYSPWSHTADEPFASTSFFAQNNMQISDLTMMQFDLFVPGGSHYSAGSPRMVLVLNTPNGDTANDKVVLVYSDKTTNFPSDTWQTLNYLDPQQTTWAAGGVGGSNSSNLANAHAAAKIALGPNYRIRVVRINFDSDNTSEAWFRNERINELILSEPVTDFSFDPLTPDNAAVPAGTLPPAP